MVNIGKGGHLWSILRIFVKLAFSDPNLFFKLLFGMSGGYTCNVMQMRCHFQAPDQLTKFKTGGVRNRDKGNNITPWSQCYGYKKLKLGFGFLNSIRMKDDCILYQKDYKMIICLAHYFCQG